VLDVMIDIAVSDMMMNCVTHGMRFASTVAHRLVFMDDKIIFESDPP
jgi:ABC-type polar amino acid transport system ATPase subunit